MKLVFTECECDGTELFRDIHTYGRVDRWADAIVDGKAEYRPLDFYVKVNGQWYCIIGGGTIHRDVCDTLKRKLKRLRVAKYTIPNDTMLIKADGFERELSINLDGE